MEESLDFRKCIICQSTDKKKTLVKQPKLSSLKSLKDAIQERHNYKDAYATRIYNRLEDLSSQELLDKSVIYHSSCYKSCTNSKTISQVQKRFSDSLDCKNLQTKPVVGRPSRKRKLEESETQSSSKKLRSSSGGKFDKFRCIICQEWRAEPLHTVEYMETGEKMLTVSRELTDKTLFLRLNSIPDAKDGVANDVQYHRTCWINTNRQMAKDKKGHTDYNEEDALTNIIADIEIVHLVDAKIRSSEVLNMNEINQAYNELLDNMDNPVQDRKKYLKKLLQETIVDVEFTKSSNKNQPEKVSSSSTKEVAADQTFCATEDDMNLLFKAAKIIRVELLKHTKWKFTGNLSDFKISSPLETFVKWMIAGPKENFEAERKAEEIKKSTNTTIQMLIGAVKTKDQVSERKASIKDFGFNNVTETPNSVGLGMYIYQKTRSKELVDNLSKANTSINYKKCTSFQNQIANHVCQAMDENNGCYVPPMIDMNSGEHPFFAIDNTDFENDTPDGKGEFHGTGMIVCQRFSGTIQKPLQFERSKSGDPSTSFKEDRFSFTYQCNAPKPPNLTYKPDPKVNLECLKEYQKENLAWVLRKYSDTSTALNIPTWSAYNSLTTEALPRTTCCSLPLLRGSPTDWSNLYTSLMRVKQINDAIDSTRRTIVSMDLQLYNKCLQLKANEEIAKDFIFRLGELHAVFAMLKVIGKYIESSGLDEILVEANVYGPVTKGQILEGKHMKRAVEAHIILYLALCHFYFDNAVNSNENLAKPFQEIQNIQTISKEDHQNAMSIIEEHGIVEALENIDGDFKMQAAFYRNYMRMVENLLLFIRASREGQWKLHLASLHYFTGLFFVHDQLNYARLTPVYLKEMIALSVDDQRTWTFFEEGNFSVNKSNVPFCAIGVDHAMEQENKSMKISGGITGLTLNQTALDRFVLTAPLISQIVEEFFVNNGINKSSSKKHHQLIGSANQRITKNVETVKTTMKKFQLSFEKSDCVFNVITKAVLSPEAATSVINHEIEGKKLLDDFNTQRLEGAVPVWEKLKKRKLPTFKTTAKSLKKKVNGKIVSLKEEKTLITRFLVMARQRPEIDLPMLLGNFEFSVIPKSIFAVDGSVHPVNDKSRVIT